MSNMPSITKAKDSASNIFSIIDEASMLDVRQKTEGKLESIARGEIVFKDVTFSYPTRSKIDVLKDF